VLEREVDHAVGVRRGIGESLEIVEVAATDLGSRCLQRGR
jgi:hypothetical protein